MASSNFTSSNGKPRLPLSRHQLVWHASEDPPLKETLGEVPVVLDV